MPTGPPDAAGTPAGADPGPEARLAGLGITLPDPLPPFGEYVPAVRSGHQLWVGGHFGTRPDGSIHTGRVGATVDVDETRDAARAAALNLLATVRAELGSLDAVARVVHVFAVVNSTPEFTGQTGVIDAASEVLVAVFGDRGRHARLAVGVAALPGDLVLAIEAVLDLVPESR
ncbi:MAG: RidA family protein [Actinobacteria bacterium]|nr:RidA family protein [Actinomycetota bacterium]